MTQYCDYSTFPFTQALPRANEPIEHVFFSMNNMKWNDAKPQVKTETLRLKTILITTKHQRAVLCLDFHVLIKSNNRLLNEKHSAYLEPEIMETQRMGQAIQHRPRP